MTLNRRHAIATLAACATLATASFAQGDKKLTIINGFPPGGAPDLVARTIGIALKDSGYTVIVENKTGAGGRLAMDAFLAAPADGSTIVVAPSSMLTIYPHIYSKLRYGLNDFAVLAGASEFHFGLAIDPRLPVQTLAQFIAWAKAHPDKAQFGTPGAGTAMHFIGVELGKAAGFDYQHIPYRGGMPAIADAMGGTIPSVFATIPSLVNNHKAGKLRVLAQSGLTRAAGLPDVQTFKEAGFPGFTTTEIFVFAAPAKTDPAVRKALSDALMTATRTAQVQTTLSGANMNPVVVGPDAMSARLKTDSVRWGDLVKATGYKTEE